MKDKEFYTVKCTVNTVSEQHLVIRDWLSTEVRGKTITFLNPHVFNHAIKDQIVKKVLNESDIVAMDGIGINLAFLVRDHIHYSRTIMTYLFEKVLFDVRLPRIKTVLIGASQNEVSKATDYINRNSPGIYIEHCFHGFHDLDYYLGEISRMKGVRMILVGMSTPRSEHLIHRLSEENTDVIIWHIGAGTIKCFANTKQRSPVWLSRIGLEWIHRSFFEPNLIWRYLFGIPCFLYNIAKIQRQTRKKKRTAT